MRKGLGYTDIVQMPVVVAPSQENVDWDLRDIPVSST